MKEKTLIIVPHQDDEIHIAGGYLASIEDTSEVYVLYTTNGDFMFDAKYRYKEALKSLKRLANIPKERVFFLGYSDQAYDQKTHMYNQDKDWKSNKGYIETYAPSGFEEWNYIKSGNHCKFNRDNFTRNIKEVIEFIKPDIIICNDLDFHPDHIMTSICTERALGEILKEDLDYKPIVLKTFSYENSYFGPNDFFDKENRGMIFKYDEFGNLCSNPYFNKDNSIICNIKSKCYTKNLFKNIIYKAIKCHKSQVLVERTGRMINSNAVYWQRNTNNLLRSAKITTSSGNVEYLTDFLLCDTQNVLNGNKKDIIYDKGIWIPSSSDNKKEINILFSSKKNVYVVRLYNGRTNKKKIDKIELSYNNKKKSINLKDTPYNDIIIDERISSIKISIKDNKVYNGFSEIELLDSSNSIVKEDFLIKNCEKGDYLPKKNFFLINFLNKKIIWIVVFLQKIYRKLFVK